MAQKKIRVGIIGASPARGWGSLVHVPALKLLPEFELVAVCNTSQESAEKAAAMYGARHAFADPAKLATHPDVDVVAVCVRVPEHVRLVGAALDARKHVYCEWALGRNTEEAVGLRDRAKQAGVKHVIGLQGRAAPEVRFVRDLIARGDIGTVLSCTMITTMPTWGDTVEPHYRFFVDDAMGVTALTISGGHALDALAQMVGGFDTLSAVLAARRTETKVEGTGEVLKKNTVDQVGVVGTLRSGAVATFHVRGGVMHGLGLMLEINGTAGDIIMTSPTAAGIQNADIRLQWTKKPGGPYEDLAVPDNYRIAPREAARPNAQNVAGLYRELGHAINGGPPVACDFDHAVAHHRLLDAIRAASATGQRQKISI